MKIKIIETGSTGNCFLFNETLIVDMGLPMSRLKEKVDFKKVTHILLTHIHGDHFNKTTLSRIFNDYPYVKFVCGEWLHEPLRLVFGGDTERINVIEMNQEFKADGFKVYGFHAEHDEPNCGYRIVDENGHKHFHVTDISTLSGLTAQSYDTATIECNYHTKTADSIIDKAREDGEFSHMTRSKRTHLSVEEVIEFSKNNNIGELTPVHIGNSTKKEVIQALRDW